MRLPFYECLILVGIHSYLGLHVIKRQVIFVDLALAQIAALGTLIAFLFGIMPHTMGAYWFSLGLTAVAAALFAFCRFREGAIPQEAIIGLVYAIAAATAILLIDKAPHGAEHLKEIMTGSILWVKASTVETAAVVYTAVGVFHYLFRKKFILISTDPEGAWEQGVNVRLWDFLFYLSFGLVITLSVDTAGVLIVFVFLVAPAIIAISLTGRWFYQILIGWTLGTVVTVTGLFISYVGDMPTGPAVIGAYALALIATAIVAHIARAEDRRVAMKHTGAAVIVVAGMLGLLLTAGHLIGKRRQGHQVTAPDRSSQTADPKAEGPLTPIENIEQIRQRLANAAAPKEESDLICRAFEIDQAAAVRLALDFLEKDPPCFFRQDVANHLNVLLDGEARFDTGKPFCASENQRAAAKVKEKFQEPR
ncbi:MAG: metal ABC transporter permease [Planctomycetes bacterium]|nr:metal ABC transporter permease [Planctomycetota bacterium]